MLRREKGISEERSYLCFFKKHEKCKCVYARMIGEDTKLEKLLIPGGEWGL